MQPTGAHLSTPWWELRDDVYAGVIDTVKRIHNDQSARAELIKRHMRLYGELDAVGVGLGGYFGTEQNATVPKLSLNVIRNMTDAVISELELSNPRPMFLTDDGDFNDRYRAEKLGKYCEGVFYQTGVDRKRQAMRRDALVFGTGVLKCFKRAGKVAVERVFPGELYVDSRDGAYGEPRAMYQTKYVDRAVLAKLYPNRKKEINQAPHPSGDWSIGYDALADQILVTEAWRLPSAEDADDGRHVIAVDTATLVDEDWTDELFPFVFLTWQTPLMGFWGTGLAFQLTGIQIEINTLLQNIQEAQALAGTFRIAVAAGSVVKGHISDEYGAILEYQGGTPPQSLQFAAVPPEMYAQLDRLYEKAYEISGVSQLSAQSQKPAGLNSGTALRSYADIQSKRFLAFGHADEDASMQLAELILRVSRDIAKDDPEFDVVYRGKGNMQRIKFEDVDLDTSSYVLQCWPVSALPNTPSGKLDSVQDLLNSGFFDKAGVSTEEVWELLDFPDLAATKRLHTAPKRLAEKRVSEMLIDGTYAPPEPFDDLQTCLKVAVLAYADARDRKAPEDRLDLVRRYIEAVQNEINPPPDPAPVAFKGSLYSGSVPGAGGPPGPPPGPPPPPPAAPPGDPASAPPMAA